MACRMKSRPLSQTVKSSCGPVPTYILALLTVIPSSTVRLAEASCHPSSGPLFIVPFLAVAFDPVSSHLNPTHLAFTFQSC